MSYFRLSLMISHQIRKKYAFWNADLYFLFFWPLSPGGLIDENSQFWERELITANEKKNSKRRSKCQFSLMCIDEKLQSSYVFVIKKNVRNNRKMSFLFDGISLIHHIFTCVLHLSCLPCYRRPTSVVRRGLILFPHLRIFPRVKKEIARIKLFSFASNIH